MKKIYSLILLIALALGGTIKAETLTVAESTSTDEYIPIYGYFADNYQHNQYIIPAGQLETMVNGIISGMKFYTAAGYSNITWNSGSAPSVTFKLAEVTESTLSDLVDASFTTVWTGTASITSGEWDLAFSENYTYEGGNLLVDVSLAKDGYAHIYFKGEAITSAAKWTYGSSQNGTRNFVPMTTFTYTPGAAPTCPKPSALKPSEVTASSATFTWTAGGSETAWQYLCLPAATALTDEAWAGATSVTEATATVSGLTANTSYKFYLRADCGSVDEQSKEISAAFTTACGTENLPFNKSFSSDANGDIPQCWLELHNGSYNKPTISSKALYFYGNNNKNNKDKKAIVILPEFEQDIQTLKISITYKNSGTGAAYPLFQIGYIPADSVNDITRFHSLKELDKYYTYSTPEYTTSTAFALTGAKSGSRIAIAYTNTTTTSTSSSPSNYAGYIQAILVESAIDCSQPQDVTISGITGEGAHVAWTALEGVTTYRYCVVAHGDAADWSKAVNVDTNSEDLTGLTAGTEYDFYVQGKCTGENWTEASAAVAFTPSACPTVTSVSLTTPLYNGVTVNWTSNGSATYDVGYQVVGGENWTVCAEEVEGNSKAITGLVANTEYIIAVKPHCSEAWLAAEGTYTPVYTLPGVPAITAITSSGANVSWDAATGGATGYEYVLMEGAAAADWTSPTATETTSATLSELTDGKQYTFYVRATFGEVKGEAVSQTFNTATIAPVISNEYTATTASITFSWTYEGSATLFQVSQNGTDWSVAQAEKEATINELTSGTSYTLYVRAYYSESVQSAGVSKAFQTECAVATLPFETEGFESGLPNCWSAASQWSVYAEYNSGHSGNQSMRFNASTTADLTLPEIELSDKAQLTFWRQSTYVSCSVYLKEGEEETKLEDFSASSDWTLSTVDLSAYAGKTVSIIIRGNYYGNSRYLYLDDVAISYLPVAAPTNVAATPADQSATVTWECEEATTYAVQYRVSGSSDEWSEVKGLTEKTYTIEGLTNGTAYEVQVKAIVSENRQSEWTASTVVTPAKCPTVTGIELSEKTFNSVKVSWTASGPGTWTLSYQPGSVGWTIIENIKETNYTLTDLTPGVTYTITVYPECSAEEGGQETSYYPAYTSPSNVVVTNISDVTATASWDAVADATLGYTYSIAPRGNQTPWAYSKVVTDETSVNLNLDAGSDYDFYVVTNYPNGWMSPDVKVEFSTITVAPKSISVSEITASSAKLTWENDGAATNYEYAVGEDPKALEWKEVAEKTKTLESLTANTSYTFYVRAKYSDKVKSDSIHITFQTDCNAIAELPWFEGFEDYAVGSSTSAAPACWAQLHVNHGLPYAYVNKWSTYVKTGSKSMYVTASSQTDGYLILPVFEAALNGLQISFSHKEENATKSAIITLGYITDITNAETFVAIQEFGRATSWQEEKEISLAGIPNEVATTARLAFKLGKANDQFYTGIDDITVSVLPNCRKPIIGETTILPDGATFTWTAGNGETKFQYAVGNDPKALEWKATESTEATVHGLVPGNNYNFYVRAFCDPEVSDSVWTAFAPVCNAPTEAALTAATATTASFSWTAAANISSYQYVVMAKGVAADWSKAKTTDNTIAEWTELAANTAYDFYVRSFFNETVQSAAASVSFQTECATITELPWNENFESFAVNTIPTCWDNTASTASSNASYYLWGVYQYNENKMIRMANYYVGQTNGSALINTPKIILPASPAQELSFDYAHNATCGDFTIKVSKDEGANWTTLQAYQKGGSSSYSEPGKFTKEIINLSEYAGETIMIQFYTEANYDKGAVFVDNISIHEIPSCAVPTELAASEVTAATATLSWTSEAANFKVQYTTDKNNWGAEHDADAASYAIEGLMPSTVYYARVKAVCGTENESAWCEEISFTTECAAVNELNEDFAEGVPECWKTSGTWSTDNDTYGSAAPSLKYNATSAGEITTVAVNVTKEEAVLQFNIKNVYNGSNYRAGRVIVKAAEVEDFSTDFINSKDIANVQVIDLAAYYGKTITITFQVDALGSTKAVYIDDVKVIVKPCDTPKNLNATASLDSVVLVWEQGGDETTYQYSVVKKGAEADWKTLEAGVRTVTVKNLLTDTLYTASVRSFCGEGREGETVLTKDFTPLCPLPSDIVITDIAVHGAHVAWTAAEGIAQYQWSLVEDEWLDEHIVAATSVDLTELTAATTYTIYVRSYNSATSVSSAVNAEFTTDCDVYTMAFAEDFNGLSAGIPVCWDNAEGTTTYAPYKWNYFATGREGACVRFDSYNNSANNTNILKTPSIEIDTESKEPELSFNFKNPAGGAFAVLVYDVTADDTTALELGELTGVAEWTQQTADLTSFKGHDVQIWFHATSNSAAYGLDGYIYLDDVSVAEHKDTPSAIGNVGAEGEKVVKRMENGILYIIRDGIKYNAQGGRISE